MADLAGKRAGSGLGFLFSFRGLLPGIWIAGAFVGSASAPASAMEPSVFSPRSYRYAPQFPPCEPISDPAADSLHKDIPGAGNPLPELEFCSKWNPEFKFNGHHCCGKGAKGSRRRRRVRCSLERAKGSYCSEITPEQEDYTRLAQEGRLGDVLDLISQDAGQKGEQSYCTVNNGFLAWGRRLIPSAENRIVLRSPERCTEFGTDPMIGMLEWMGREIAKDYSSPDFSGVRLVVGDISAPRGGCLSGRGGRRGHLSHTTGQDVDISFLFAKERVESPVSFHKQFDAAQNWYLLKKIFENPFACVKAVFVDRRLIGKLSRIARADEAWSRYRRFVRHMPGHRNHFHVRIGDGPGEPGCTIDARPELEVEDDGDEYEVNPSEMNPMDSASDILSEIRGDLPRAPASKSASLRSKGLGRASTGEAVRGQK